MAPTTEWFPRRRAAHRQTTLTPCSSPVHRWPRGRLDLRAPALSALKTLTRLRALSASPSLTPPQLPAATTYRGCSLVTRGKPPPAAEPTLSAKAPETRIHEPSTAASFNPEMQGTRGRVQGVSMSFQIPMPSLFTPPRSLHFLICSAFSCQVALNPTPVRHVSANQCVYRGRTSNKPSAPHRCEWGKRNTTPDIHLRDGWLPCCMPNADRRRTISDTGRNHIRGWLATCHRVS